MVESTLTVQPISPAVSARACTKDRIRAQTPSRCHRRNHRYNVCHGGYTVGTSRHGEPVLTRYRIPSMITLMVHLRGVSEAAGVTGLDHPPDPDLKEIAVAGCVPVCPFSAKLGSRGGCPCPFSTRWGSAGGVRAHFNEVAVTGRVPEPTSTKVASRPSGEGPLSRKQGLGSSRADFKKRGVSWRVENPGSVADGPTEDAGLLSDRVMSMCRRSMPTSDLLARVGLALVGLALVGLGRWSGLGRSGLSRPSTATRAWTRPAPVWADGLGRACFRSVVGVGRRN